MIWLEEYASLYSERVTKGKMSNARIVTMTGLPLAHAKALAAFCRRGIVPDPMLPNPDSEDHDASEPDATEVPRAEPSSQEAAQYLHDKQYVYNDGDDTYVTFIPGLPKPLVLPGSVHREIVRAYSNFDGNPATVNELARTVRLPRQWINKYLRVHGITHDMEPFTSEEIMSRSDNELVEDALQLRRATLYKKLEQAKWADIRQDAMKWREVEDHLLRVIQTGLVGRTPANIPKLDIAASEEPFCAVVGLTDFHWGKYGDIGETGEAYNRDIAEHRLFRATQDVFSQVARLGRPEKLLVPIGSDFLHIDNPKGMTTDGTPQDMDGTPAEILVSACKLMEDWIHTLRQVAPVELVLMSGNHDRMLGLALLLYLEALFRGKKDVTARLDRQPRVYRTYGKNLLGFVHGDGVKKTQDMAGLMAREAAAEWSQCPFRTIYTGHLHYEKSETDVAFGVTRRQIPSLSGTDRWHSLNGFVGSPKSLPVYLHDRQRGLVAVLHSPLP